MNASRTLPNALSFAALSGALLLLAPSAHAQRLRLAPSLTLTLPRDARLARPPATRNLELRWRDPEFGVLRKSAAGEAAVAAILLYLGGMGLATGAIGIIAGAVCVANGVNPRSDALVYGGSAGIVVGGVLVTLGGVAFWGVFQ